VRSSAQTAGAWGARVTWLCVRQARATVRAIVANVLFMALRAQRDKLTVEQMVPT